MPTYPEDEHLRDATATAYIDETSPDHGYVRFELPGRIETYRLPLPAFARLARDIQNAMRRSGPQNQPPFPANDQ
jgi:hypothetical protein